MEEKQFYHQIQKVLDSLPENFSILEEQIDIEIQVKYFKTANKIRQKGNAEEYFKNRDELFLPEIDVERKRKILLAIAAIDDVKAFRAIEKFVTIAEGEIKQWAVLAMQESRMLIQSSLLEEQQVFISTGLGGKGRKLRYYVVFINKKQNEILTPTQQKLLKDELIYQLNQNNGEFESMDFSEGFSTVLVMLPLQTDLKKLFRDVIDECNQYGDFLDDDLIVTNVKVMSRNEIIEMLKQKKEEDFDDFEELDE
ncbi:MAG: hypothetical protein EP310_07905 [Bacteroidetes bacterium]|nr:MAG: hypothetical protein EP310_07905 [Bacteroidota bacterium]